MSSTIKFSPPIWDSDKDKPSWRDFSHKFESFVDYQPGGIVLLNLALHILGKTNKFVSTESTLDDDLSFDASQGKVEEREVKSVKELNPEECKLDRSLYNIQWNGVFKILPQNCTLYKILFLLLFLVTYLRKIP